jgi:tetratricopeptide (TPR) repeat protein
VAIKAGRPADAIRPLEAALIGEPPGSRAAAIHYYLGVAYARSEIEKSIAHLQAAIAGDVDQDDARFQLASVLDRSGSYAQARVEYDRFATAHPQSPLAMFAMRRSATLARFPASAPPAAVAPPPAAANPTGPAPAASPTRPPAGVSPSGPSPAVLPRPPAGQPQGASPSLGAGPRGPGSQPWLKPPVKPALPTRPAVPSDPVEPATGPNAP